MFLPSHLYTGSGSGSGSDQKSTGSATLAALYRIFGSRVAWLGYRYPPLTFVIISVLYIVRYQCSNCDYASVEKAALEKHHRFKHTNERPFMCDTCGFR